MKSKYYKISEMVKDKVEDIGEYYYYINNWSNKTYENLPPFENGENNLFEEFLTAGQENQEEVENEIYEKWCKLTCHIYNNGPYTDDIMYYDENDNDYHYFSTKTDLPLQLEILMNWLKISKSKEKIPFIIYGNKNNDLIVIHGKITAEYIIW